MASRGIPAAGDGGGQSGGRALGLGLWPLPVAGWLPIATLALIFAGHLLYAAIVSEMAMALEIGAALLVSAALLDRRLRADLERIRGLALPAGLFALVLLVALWTLTPWTPGGPHPVWAYVGVSPAASTIDKSSTIVEIVKLLGLACLFTLGLVSGAQDPRGRFAVRLSIWASVVFGLWAFAAFTTNSTDHLFAGRLNAHFLSANTAGLFFGVSLVIALAEAAAMWRRSRPRDRIQLLPLSAAVFVLAVCLMATASRGAIAGTAVGIAAYVGLQVWTGRLKVGRSLLWFGAIVVVATALVLFAGGELIDRVTHDQNDIARIDVWRAHWRAFLDAPVFGYGLGAEKTVNRTLLNAANFKALWSIIGIHNVYLQWLEDAGVVGALPMFGAIGAVIVGACRGYARRSRMTGVLAGLIAADVVILLQGATDFGLEAYSMAAFWAWLLGLQFALAQGTSQR